MKTIPHYCQNCGAGNQLGERDCTRCGTRLMLVVFPPSIRHDDGIVPSYYEDHLLERVTLLEIRLSQMAERLALALELMVQQSRNTHSDHMLLDSLIESLSTLGTLDKDQLRLKWQKKIKSADQEEEPQERFQRILQKISRRQDCPNPELFQQLLREGFKFLEQNDEKQALRNFARAAVLSPNNVSLLLFIAEMHFAADQFEAVQKHLERILPIEPQNEQARLILGLLAADALRSTEARNFLEATDRKSDQLICADFCLGFLAAFDQDWEQALGYFRQALQRREIPETNYLVGCVLFQQGNYQKALSFLQKAVERDGKFADGWFMQAMVYRELGNELLFQQSREVAWAVKEPGAECLKFFKQDKDTRLSGALPFLRLQGLTKHLIMSSPLRFTKIIRKEVSHILNSE